MENDVYRQFENGIFAGGGWQTDFGTLRWERHQEYDGVSLKHLVNTDRTGGRFSCHLVRIAPDCRIGVVAPFDVPDENLMAFNLQGKNTPLNGMLEYAKEFFER